MAAEPQTPGDVTLRLYDWTEEYDRPRRSLHTEQALLALEIDPPGGVFLEPMEGAGERLLTDCPDYRVWERRRRDEPFRLGEEGELRILAVVRGRARLEHGDDPPRFLSAGGTALIPAAAIGETQVAAVGETILLEVIPTPQNPA